MKTRLVLALTALLGLSFLPAGARAAEVEGVWLWNQGRGKLILNIEGNKVTGKFVASYVTGRLPDPPKGSGPDQPVNVSGQSWGIQGQLDGTFNPQSGEIFARLSGQWNFYGFPEGHTSPFPAENQAPLSGEMRGKLTNKTFAGTWSASTGAAASTGGPPPPGSLSGSFTSEAPVSSRKPQCAEGSFYYPDDVLAGYYTDQPSLNQTREQLVKEVTDALARYRSEGGVPAAGVDTLDSINIAQTLATTALPSGKESQLQAAARQLAQGGKKVSPGDFLYLSLKLNGGNVKQALLTAHAALYRDGAKRNRAFIDSGILRPMRNPAGYADKQVGAGNQQVSVRKSVGSDEQGVWYHFFGMAALEFADSKSMTGIAPLSAVWFGAETFAGGSFADKVSKLKTVPSSGLGGAVSDFAVAVENAIRKEGSVPDPDKQCVNYSGVAAGRALARAFNLGQDQDQVRIDRLMQGPISGGTVTIRSPLSVEILGSQGERVAFDQQTRRFSANAAAFVNATPQKDNTTALIISPFFTISRVNFTGSGSGAATVAYYDTKSHTSGVYSLTVQPGARYEVSNWGTSPSFKGNAPATTAPQPPAPPKKEELLVRVGNIYAVENGPTVSAGLMLDQSYRFTRIVTYHWNSARGKAPGTIALRADNGKLYGPWQAVGSPGQGGVPNAYWTVSPNVVLPAGHYTILDSDPASWSFNAASKGIGFVDIYGYSLP